MFKNLKRPICFIDLETTGLSTQKDRIVEISICKIHVDGTKEIKTKLFNPEIPISPEASAIHGYTNESLKDEPVFKKLAKGLAAFIADSDLGGFRSNAYDFPLLSNEFERAGITWNWQDSNLIDSYNILVAKEPRTLGGVYTHYTGEIMENAHSAKADILATVEIFEKQVEKYELAVDNMNELALLSNYGKKMVDLSGKFTEDVDGDLVLNFGKHKGKKAKEERGFLEWMLTVPDFSDNVKGIVNKLLEA